MDEPSSPTESQEQAVQAFWDIARFHAKLNTAPAYFGPTTLEVVPPPTWSFGDAPGSERLLAELLSGSMSTLTAPTSDYESTGEPLPEPGSLSILLDGGGRPVALLEVTEVEVAGSTVTEHLRVVYRAE